MIEIEQYLEQRRQVVEQALESFLEPRTGLPETLHEAMRYSVFCGGKRLRPILCLAAAEAVGAAADVALLPAVAVEILHTYTLIHDDLPSMDNDDERRGKPTSHIVYGEGNAILAGDALQALAFHMIARVEAPNGYPPNQVSCELTAAAMCVVGGQFADLASSDGDIDEALIDFVHRNKTAELFKAAIRMGAIVGGATPQQLDALTRYAMALGVAFQIVDDILDADSQEDPGEPGLSCIGVYGLERARQKAVELTDEATACLAGFGDAAEPLVALAETMRSRTY